MNTYEVIANMAFLQVKHCDPCLSAVKWFVYHARRYTSALLYLFLLVSEVRRDAVICVTMK